MPDAQTNVTLNPAFGTSSVNKVLIKGSQGNLLLCTKNLQQTNKKKGKNKKEKVFLCVWQRRPEAEPPADAVTCHTLKHRITADTKTCFRNPQNTLHAASPLLHRTSHRTRPEQDPASRVRPPTPGAAQRMHIYSCCSQEPLN